MNGFSAADMSTAAANGFRDGLAAQNDAAQAEVERAQANLDAGWYARREQHARSLGYSGVADALEALEAASTPAAPGIDLATAWAEGYRSGVTDERISESNIGIAGFGAKIEPARANPYMIDASPKGGITDENIDLLPELRDVEDYFTSVDPNPIHLATVRQAISFVTGLKATSAEVGT